MPHMEFLKLAVEIKQHHLFARWSRRNAVGDDPSPIELLLLGALRYLGRGLTFDDLEEYSSISEETHRRFFHAFVHWGEIVLFPQHVRMPSTAAEYQRHRKEFDEAGMTGAGFSTDATNVIMWRCSHNLRQAHLGFKSSHPSRSYNLTCNHRKEILYTTTGHPARWNDKTLAFMDEFLIGIHDGRLLQDVQYSLLSRNSNNEIVETKYLGAWGITDNGYHKWPCTQAPGKSHILRTEERFSEWLESMRKDVECTFGILKGRWRILQTGIRVHGVVATDRIWLTCCALHNRLLKVDGLDGEWNGAMGLNDVHDMRRLAPFALRRLTNNELARFGSREHERENDQTTTLLVHSALDEENMDTDEVLTDTIRRDPTGAIYINSLSYSTFRARLVENFTIRFERHEVKWPKRS
jgi:DDE superfamily endonuclease